MLGVTDNRQFHRTVCFACMGAFGVPALLVWAFGDVSLHVPDLYTSFIPSAISLVFGLVAPVVVRNTGGIRPSLVWLVHQTGEGLAVMGAITLLIIGITFTTVLITPYTGPTVDAWLALPERWIGLTQPEVKTMTVEAGLGPALAMIYGSPALQLRLAFLWWFFVGRDTRPLWESAALLSLCAVVGLPMYLCMPAAGPATFYQTGYEPSFLGPWLAMRTGDPYEVLQLDGLVSAPSFHMIFAALLTRMWWDTPFRLAAVVINFVMILATWVVGEHYLTDMFLGMAVLGAAEIFLRFLGRKRA